MEILGLHKDEFFRHLDFIKTYLNIDSANIHTTLTAPLSPKDFFSWFKGMFNLIIPEVYLYTKILNNIGCGV
jgi:hypothetical protein